MFRYAVILFILFFLSLSIASTNVINKIFIEGNQRIERSTILSYLNISKNKEVSAEDLNLVLKD